MPIRRFFAEGVAWLEEEFDFLWNAARPLPEAVIREVRGFITECLRHYHNHTIVRLLLADEVRLGKTL